MSNTADKGRLVSVGESRAVATLMLVMMLLFTAWLGVALAVPGLPLHVHEALAYVPAPSTWSPALVCDAEELQ